MKCEKCSKNIHRFRFIEINLMENVTEEEYEGGHIDPWTVDSFRFCSEKCAQEWLLSDQKNAWEDSHHDWKRS